MVGPMRGDNTGAAIAIVMGVCLCALALFVMGLLGYLIGGSVGVVLIFIALAALGFIIHAVKGYLDIMTAIDRLEDAQ